MREKRWYPVFYMFIVTAFFSSVVIGISQLTSERVAANKMRAFEQAVLSVIPGMFDPAAGDMELHRRFTETLDEPDEFSAGAYTQKKDDRVTAYALPISGRGFWAPIKGVIGIAADKRTVNGIAFYEQNETPGLGAEIATARFCGRFQSKVISMGDKPIDIIRSGQAEGQSDVFAVTGATQTCDRLENIINDELRNWLANMDAGEDRK